MNIKTFFEELEYLIWDAKITICNKLICFLMKHCYLYASTLYTMIAKVNTDELKLYIKSYEDWREEKNNGK